MQLTTFFRQESRKLSLLEARLAIYTTVRDHVSEIAFNENRQQADFTSNNDKQTFRAIVTFRQMKMLLDRIIVEELGKSNKLVIDWSRITKNWTQNYWIELDAFYTASKAVRKIYVKSQFMEIVYLEATWPAAAVAHRIKPLPGSILSHTKKRPRWTDSFESKGHEKEKNYQAMLQNLMAEIQSYLLLQGDDDNLMKKSMDLVEREPRQPVMCVWLKEIEEKEQ